MSSALRKISLYLGMGLPRKYPFLRVGITPTVDVADFQEDIAMPYEVAVDNAGDHEVYTVPDGYVFDLKGFDATAHPNTFLLARAFVSLHGTSTIVWLNENNDNVMNYLLPQKLTMKAGDKLVFLIGSFQAANNIWGSIIGTLRRVV